MKKILLIFILGITISSCKKDNTYPEGVNLEDKEAMQEYLTSIFSKSKLPQNGAIIILNNFACKGCVKYVKEYLITQYTPVSNVYIIVLGETKKSSENISAGLEDLYEVYYDYSKNSYANKTMISNAFIEISNNKITKFFYSDVSNNYELMMTTIKGYLR